MGWITAVKTGIEILDITSTAVECVLSKKCQSSFDRISTELNKNMKFMKMDLNQNFEEIKKNLKAINRNHQAISEVGSKVDQNLDKMIELFENTEKIFEQMDKKIKNEFDVLRNSIEESRIETFTEVITFSIERLVRMSILIFGLTKELLPSFLVQPMGGINFFLETKENLYKTIQEVIENSSKYIKPKNEDDESAFKGIQILLMGLNAYFVINLNLINSYKYMANHYYQLNHIDSFNTYLLTLSSLIKSCEIDLIGIGAKIGLIESVKNILVQVEALDFIQQERVDMVHFLSEIKKSHIDKFEMEFQKIKIQNIFIDHKPIINIHYDFFRSNVTTPWRKKWIDGQTVSYALQYKKYNKNGIDLSLISEWSDLYEVYQKGCPYLKLDDNYTEDVERIVFRKFSNEKPELVARFKNKKQNEFRDINRDLFDAVIMDANEELAIKNLNFLLGNDANINAVYENEKSLVHFVIEKNKLNLLKELIKNNAFIDLGDKDGRQPIHAATENNLKEMVQILLDHGADVNAKTNLNWTPIHFAFKTGNEEIASLLINKGSNVTLTTKNDFNVFHIATSSGKANMINLDKIKDIDINAKSSKGLNVLHLSVIGEHTSLIETLLNNNRIDVNAESEGKISALHLSAMIGNLEIAKQLLKHKDINVNQLTSDGWSALQLTILSEKEEVAFELLKQKNIDIDLEGQSKLTAIHLATIKNMTRIVSELIKKKVRLEKRDSNGFTSLHLAAMNGCQDIVELLVYEGKACLNVKDKEGNTPLIASVLNGYFKIVEFLVREGSRIGEKNNDGYNAIELSARIGNVEIFRYLKEKAKSQKINYTLNSLNLACSGNQPKIVQIMIDDGSKEILNLEDIKQNSVLHHASRGGNVEIMEFLLKEPYNLTAISNQTNIDGDNILHIAAGHQNFKLIRYLRSKRIEVDLNKLNQDQNTPILKAAEQASWPIVDYLLKDKKINPILKNKEGNSLLHYACRANEKKIIGYLINELELNVNDLNEHGWSSLSFGARHGHFKLAQYLIEQKNADYKLVDKSGFSILHLAVESGNLELVEYLFDQKELNPISPENTTSCLHLSAKQNHLEVLKYLLTKQLNIDAIDENGNTPLLIAGKSKNWEIVEYLIKQNANAELLDNEMNSIIHEIATSDRVNLLELLKNKEISKEKRLKNSQGMTAMHNSARSPDSTLKMLRYLVEELHFIFDKDNLGNTPAHYSANDLEAIVYLNDKFYIDRENHEGKTPCNLTEDLRISKFLIENNADYSNNLFQNVISNSLGVLKYLIEVRGMDPNEIDENEKNILMYAAEKGFKNIVQYLVSDLRMDITKTDKDGNVALFYVDKNLDHELFLYLCEMNNNFKKPSFKTIIDAIDHQSLEDIEYLILFEHADPNQFIDSDYTSLLHYATKQMNLEMVKYLVSKGANIYARDIWNNTSAHEASWDGSLNLVQYFILEKKMNPNLRGYNGQNLLHRAATNNRLQVVKLLVEKTKIDLYQKDFHKKTALDLSIMYGYNEVADYLRSYMKSWFFNRIKI